MPLSASGPMIITDCSNAIIKQICVPFDVNVLTNYELLSEALQSPLLTKIPLFRSVRRAAELCLPASSFQLSTASTDAALLVDRFIAFSDRSHDLHANEKSFLFCITEITGILWKMISQTLNWNMVFTYFLHSQSGATVGYGRPYETDYVNDFMICKVEHKDLTRTDAVVDLTKKMAHYNSVNYGDKIVFLPVIAAAGSTVELGVVDVRMGKTYHYVRRYDLTNSMHRDACFVGMLNCYRLFCTMLPFVPLNPIPWFQTKKNITFLVDKVVKKITHTTYPPMLYDLLESRAVPCAVRVVRSRDSANTLYVSPVGSIIRSGRAVEANELRRAVRSVLQCLEYLHQAGNNFVHRDIRWLNIIKVPVTDDAGFFIRYDFLVIDFEFAACSGDVMSVEQYIHRDVVPTGEKFTQEHDMKLVGKLLRSWASDNSEELVGLASQFADELELNRHTASSALHHVWFSEA